MNNPIIEVKNLSKKYTLGERQPYYSFRDTISGIFHTPFRRERLEKDEFWALKDVSFDVNEGDVVGVIGRNGAGKSTLLKILSQITPPTEGEIILRGRVASLLEIGTGFHPELTGRENIYLNGAILGMKRWEINNKFKEIIDFSEIEKFLDTPVKHYSSGMYTRLAFSVAAHLEPEILLVDEVLAVGDAQFQKKCLGKMSEVSKQGRTVFFVSHNLSAVESLCNKAILLEGGSVVSSGNTRSIVQKYIETNSVVSSEIIYNKQSSKDAYIKKISVMGDINSLSFNKRIKFIIDLNIQKKIQAYMGISIINWLGQVIVFWRDYELNEKLLSVRKPGKYSYEITIPANTLSPGSYSIQNTLVYLNQSVIIDEPSKNIGFKVTDSSSIRSMGSRGWNGLTSIKLLLKYNNEK